jgi:ESX-1-secreted protein regulator
MPGVKVATVPAESSSRAKEVRLCRMKRRLANRQSTPALRTLADKVNWLIDRAHPAGRGSYSDDEIATLIQDTTGEEVSYTTIWKLRNGQAQNPQKRLIEALAKTFGIPACLLRRLRPTSRIAARAGRAPGPGARCRISGAQLRAILELSPQARQPIISLAEATARRHAQAPQRARQSELNYFWLRLVIQ